MLVTSAVIPSLYDRVHLVTGNPGQYAMSWHRKKSLNAGYSASDAQLSRPVCTYGTMHQTRTNHRRIHRSITSIPGQQLVMDAYSHPHQSRSKAYYCDLITCLDSGLIIPVFTNNRSAPELCHQIASSLFCYPS
jgi:hypothetical protein